MTFDPVLDCAANHNLLFLAQAIWISQVWWNFERASPFSFWYENVAIFLLIKFCIVSKKMEKEQKIVSKNRLIGFQKTLNEYFEMFEQIKI